MACRASGKSTLRMSGTCTTRGMDSILLDTTAAGYSSRATLTAYSLPIRARHLPATRPAHSHVPFMIVTSFGCYLSRTAHDHETPRAPRPAASPATKTACSFRAHPLELNRQTAYSLSYKPPRRGGSDGPSGRDRPGQDGPAHRQEPDGARLPRHRLPAQRLTRTPQGGRRRGGQRGRGRRGSRRHPLDRPHRRRRRGDHRGPARHPHEPEAGHHPHRDEHHRRGSQGPPARPGASQGRRPARLPDLRQPGHGRAAAGHHVRLGRQAERRRGDARSSTPSRGRGSTPARSAPVPR